MIRRHPEPAQPLQPPPVEPCSNGRQRLKLPNTYPEGRRCAVCEALISRYNAGDRCYECP